MLEDRKKALRDDIARKEKELAKLDQLPDLGSLADGSIVALFVRHARSKTYTYVAYLTRGRFYLTGSVGPNGVNASVLADWLVTGGRTLVGIVPVAVLETATVSSFDLAEALLENMAERRTWNPYADNSYGD